MAGERSRAEIARTFQYLVQKSDYNTPCLCLYMFQDKVCNCKNRLAVAVVILLQFRAIIFSLKLLLCMASNAV